tara:strand:+ start:1921 stop:2376 length:456 start_codon:yes stop_codon:yes gene_type:complete
MLKKDFIINWILVGELAVGTAPRSKNDLEKLNDNGINSILCLCSETDSPLIDGIEKNFNYKISVLPDHRSEEQLTLEKIEFTLIMLKDLMKSKPVFVHCLASMERSPLICMGWLIKEKGLTFNQALDYMMQTHKRTNPLTEDLNLLMMLKH